VISVKTKSVLSIHRESVKTTGNTEKLRKIIKNQKQVLGILEIIEQQENI